MIDVRMINSTASVDEVPYGNIELSASFEDLTQESQTQIKDIVRELGGDIIGLSITIEVDFQGGLLNENH